MAKLLEFGRKALFYVRVLSGYEERRIRSFRLQLEKHLQQVILTEVQRMVEEMQALNKKLEDMEAAIEDYFKPVDKQAEAIMKMQLEGEEKTMKEMMKTMQRQALLKKDEKDKLANAKNVADFNWHRQIPNKREEKKG